MFSQKQSLTVPSGKHTHNSPHASVIKRDMMPYAIDDAKTVEQNYFLGSDEPVVAVILPFF